MRRRPFFCVLFLLLLLPLYSWGEESAVEIEPLEESAVFPPEEYSFSRSRVYRYQSDTLIYSIERFSLDGVICYLSKIWVQDPARQIGKATAEWEKDIRKPSAMVKDIPEAVLISNGSGYVSPRYPGIPDSYPGTSEDYYYTPLGSLTVTDGEVFRNLQGVPYYGLTLEEDGLHMYTGADNEEVLASHPLQTWSFYEQCGLARDGESLLPAPHEWPFADRSHRRSVIARVNRNNYLMLHVTRSDDRGLSLHRVNNFLLKNFQTEWIYNLDGGPSSTLLYRQKVKRPRLIELVKNGQQVADVIYFTE